MNETWYFTFGFGQENSGHYVKIRGTFESARKEMFIRFGKAWAFQYSEAEWLKWIDRARDMGIPVETELGED